MPLFTDWKLIGQTDSKFSIKISTLLMVIRSWVSDIFSTVLEWAWTKKQPTFTRIDGSVLEREWHVKEEAVEIFSQSLICGYKNCDTTSQSSPVRWQKIDHILAYVKYQKMESEAMKQMLEIHKQEMSTFNEERNRCPWAKIWPVGWDGVWNDRGLWPN
jgi:hypothetical protein